MEAFLIIMGLFAFVTSIILPWINRSSILKLRATILRLQGEVAQLRTMGVAIPAAPAHSDAAPPVSSPPEAKVETMAPAAPSAPEGTYFDPFSERPPVAGQGAQSAAPQEQQAKPQSLEQQFGGQAFVWLGGIALALAGVFMVKYSIEMGLLNPAVRVVIGLIFGAALLGGGAWVRGQQRIANGVRIAQALSGAGIADLYVTVFAATTLYQMIPDVVGFGGLAAVTAGAVVLSLRHGVPIALLGLVGGFLTPALVSSSSPSAPLLFLYLYFVLTGLMVVIRKQGWWFLAIPTVLVAFLWVPIWLFGGHSAPADMLWLGLFLAAVSVTVIGASKETYADEVSRKTNGSVRRLNYLTLGCAIALMGITAAHGGFGVMEWGLFGLLSVGGIGLAFFDPKLYWIAPWASLAVNAMMLMAWNYEDPQHFAVTLAAFATLYVASGYGLQSRSASPLIWAGLTMAASLGYYLLGYVRLHDAHLLDGVPLFWGTLALAFSCSSLYVLQTLMRDVPKDHPHKQHLLAIYAALTTAFLSIALSIELKREFLSVAFAGEMLAIAWINTRVDIRALRSIAMILACVFGALLLPQIVLLLQLTAFSLFETQLSFRDNIPIVNWPVFQLGVPALFFLGSAYGLRQKKDDGLVRSFEAAAIALLGVMGYYVMRHAFHDDQTIMFVKAGFTERSVITNVFFACGVVCLMAGRIYDRKAVSLSGLVLSGIALFRVGYFGLIAYNPLWSAQAVGTWPILNGLLHTYGLPILWVWLVNRELPFLNKAAWSRYGSGIILLLAFLLASLEVRQFFHGAYLNAAATSNGEIYAYSIVWLLFGAGLLFVGTLRGNALVRTVSLPILLLTIGKVFLYDASELTGLWRVFSFFGLGLSLLALSWFYSRFVFNANPALDRRRP